MAQGGRGQRLQRAILPLLIGSLTVFAGTTRLCDFALQPCSRLGRSYCLHWSRYIAPKPSPTGASGSASTDAASVDDSGASPAKGPCQATRRSHARAACRANVRGNEIRTEGAGVTSGLPTLNTLPATEPTSRLLNSTVELGKKVVGQFGSHEFTDTGLASLLGHDTAKSGAFRQRQADLRRFGLIDGRGDKLHASMWAKAASAPGPGELSGALSQTAFRIPLYRSLHDKYKGAVPAEEDFLTTLVDLTGLARSDLMPHVKSLLGLYTDVCRTLGMAPPNPTAPPSHSSEHPAPGSITTGARLEEFHGRLPSRPQRMRL